MQVEFAPDTRSVTISAGTEQVTVYMDGDIPTVTNNGCVVGTLSLDPDS